MGSRSRWRRARPDYAGNSPHWREVFSGETTPAALDRGEVVEVGFEVRKWSGCIEINDTNPAESECDLGDDVKIYCPGVGVVQDQDLELVWRGFVGCDGDHDHKRWRNKWNRNDRRF